MYCSTSISNFLKFTGLWWYCLKIFLSKKSKLNTIFMYMYTYPSILQNPQLGVDKFQWQTVIDESSSRCQFPSQTEVKIQFTIISKFLQLLSIFFYLSFVDVRLRDAKKHKIEWNFAVEKSPTRIESIIKISTCISLLMLRLTFQNHMTCLEFLW